MKNQTKHTSTENVKSVGWGNTESFVWRDQHTLGAFDRHPESILRMGVKL